MLRTYARESPYVRLGIYVPFVVQFSISHNGSRPHSSISFRNNLRSSNESAAACSPCLGGQFPLPVPLTDPLSLHVVHDSHKGEGEDEGRRETQTEILKASSTFQLRHAEEEEDRYAVPTCAAVVRYVTLGIHPLTNLLRTKGRAGVGFAN